MDQLQILSTTEDRETWLESRQGRIGGSDIAIIAGLNKYKSVLQLWAEWTGKVPVDICETPAMKFGRLVEPAIRELFKDSHPEFHVHANNKTFISALDDRFIATPDAFLAPLDIDEMRRWGGLEIKSSRDYASWDEGIPDAAHCQAIWQQGVCGLKWGWVTGLIKGNANDRKEVEVPFAQDLWEQLVEKALSFLEHVERDTPPDPGQYDSKLIDSLVKREEKRIDLGDGAQVEAERLAEAQKMLRDLGVESKHWEGQKKDAENKLKAHMKDATHGILPSGTSVLLSKVERQGFVVQPTSYWQLKLKNIEE